MTSHPTDLPLANQVALVTGAAKRIGATIASRLHAAGANVAIHYRSSQADANALCERLNDLRAGSAQVFSADLNAEDAAPALAAAVTAWSGNLNILVNNASSFYPTPLGTITEADWSDLMGSNLKAPLFLSQALLPSLRASKGCIVNIVDIHAKRPLRDHVVYGAAKAGLVMLTRALAKDLAPYIRVNGVAPGAVIWPDSGMTDDIKSHILEQVPLGRQGAPDDIADAVIFLASDATYVTGQILAVDGGRSLGW